MALCFHIDDSYTLNSILCKEAGKHVIVSTVLLFVNFPLLLFMGVVMVRSQLSKG